MLCYLPKPRNTVCLDFKALQAICKPDMKGNNDDKNQYVVGFVMTKQLGNHLAIVTKYLTIPLFN